MRAVLRRTQGARPGDDEPEPDVLAQGPLRLDLHGHRCHVGEQEVPLTLTEFRMLQTLLGAPGRAFSRDELVERTYEGRHFVSGRTVDSHVRRIRQKLRDAGLDELIETVHGLGFRLRRA